MNWESTVLELLSASLVRPFVLVFVAVLVLRAFRVEHPASKHAVWTAVLVGILVLPFLSFILPHIRIRALPQGTLVPVRSLDPEPNLLPNRESAIGAPFSGESAEELQSSAASQALTATPGVAANETARRPGSRIRASSQKRPLDSRILA